MRIWHYYKTQYYARIFPIKRVTILFSLNTILFSEKYEMVSRIEHVKWQFFFLLWVGRKRSLGLTMFLIHIDAYICDLFMHDQNGDRATDFIYKETYSKIDANGSIVFPFPSFHNTFLAHYIFVRLMHKENITLKIAWNSTI